MAQETLSVFQKSLRYFHGPRMAKAIPQKIFFLLMAQDKSDTVRFGGRDATMLFPVHKKRNWGTGAKAEGGDFGTPRQHGFDQYSVGLADLDVNFEISDKLVKATASRPDLSYVKRALDFEAEGVIDTAQKLLAIQIFGDGTGAIAQVETDSGAITSSGFYVDNPGIEHLEIGMNIEAYDAANKASGGSNQFSNGVLEITDINPATNFVTVSADPTGVANNDWLFLSGHQGKTNMMGLLGHIDDGTALATYQGITRSGNRYSQAHVISNSNNPLNEGAVFAVLRRLVKHSIKERIDHIITDPLSCDWLGLSLLDRQRFSGTTLVGGYAGVKFETPFGTKTIVPDPLAWPGYMYFICFEDMGFGWMGDKGGGWFDEDGNMLRPKISSTSGTGYAAAWVASWQMYVQMIGENPLNQALLKDYVSP